MVDWYSILQLPRFDIKLFLLRISFWPLALGLAGLHTWAAIRSSSMNADGIAYLDIGDAYMRGDWSNAINPVWSPLYSWILGAVMAIVQPPMTWEFPVVHLVNLALFLFAFLCFDFFWRQLGRSRQEATGAGGYSWPGGIWLALGYSLFIWVALSLIAIWAVTPDMLMAAFVLLAAGLIVRLRARHDGWSTFLLLGLVLGLAYLAKAIMFPLAFVFLLVAWFSAGDLRLAAPRTAVALLAFLAVSLPFILAISRSHGSFTFGEAGTITYLRYVNGIPYPHWQGDDRLGSPLHPSRQLLSNPPVYEFGEPIGGTYPISYNPAYWYEGATAQLNPGRQLQAIIRNGLYYFDLFGRQQGGLLTLTILLYAIGGPRPPSLCALLRRWGLILPALAAFVLYALVYAEGRYVGVFVLLLWAGLLANVRLPESPSSPKIIRAAGLLMVGFILANVAAFNLEGYGRLTAAGGAALPAEAPRARPVEVAEALGQLGVGPGSTVGVIGYAFDSFWARLARVRIVSEMVDWPANPFWWGEAALQESVLEAFAASGACAVVAEYAPAGAQLRGWRQIGASSYYVYLLDEEC
jgi:4-amino-4-deoxy-L-arabinose transferase-like glycosyltransferase